MQHSTQAIILKKISYGEADLIVTFFGREEGRLTGIAKNARLSHRRFGGALELGSLVNLHYVTRIHSSLVRLEDAQVSYPTTGIVQSLERINALAKSLELALAFLQERQASPEKFDLLSKYIFFLTKTDPQPQDCIAFELKWLSLVGYKPQLDSCLNCGRYDEQPAWSFSLDQGGIMCSQCIGLNTKLVSLNEQSLQNMRLLATSQKVSITNSQGLAIQGLLTNYIEYILGRPLNLIYNL
ncbi:MAG: DNA repair protein RecO [Pseudomonadota bacterium]